MQHRKKKNPSAPSRSNKHGEKGRTAKGITKPRGKKATEGHQITKGFSQSGSKKGTGGHQAAKAPHGNRKQEWKPGNMLYPVPAVMVTVADKAGRDNIITVAWAGTICTNPPMVSVSVRPERYSYHMIEETGEFVINLSTKELAYATDFCGVQSGRKVDKFQELHLTRQKASQVRAPLIGESPVNIECRVTGCIALGSHHMFLAEVAAVHVSEGYLDPTGAFHLEQAEPMVYSHGTYFGLGDALGTFGYSAKKKQKKKENIPKQ